MGFGIGIGMRRDGECFVEECLFFFSFFLWHQGRLDLEHSTEKCASVPL